MKNKLLLLLLTSFLFVACGDNDDDFAQDIVYNFSVAETFETSTFTNNPVIFNITIANLFSAPVPDDLSFKMTYTTSSTGLFSVGAVNYSQNQDIPLNVGTNFLSYLPQAVGTHVISARFENSRGQVVEKSYTIVATQPSFSFNLTNTNQSPFPGLEYSINQIITNNVSPTGTTFTGKVEIVEGSAEFRKDGEIVFPNSSYTIDPNAENPILIKPLNTGSLRLIFKVTSSTGQENVRELTWGVNAPTFNFNLNNTTQNNIIVGEPRSIDLFVEPSQNYPANSEFVFKYTLTQGSATLSYGGSVIDQNINNPIATNANVPLSITPQSAGQLQILFTATDMWGTTRTRTLSWNVVNANFTFTATTSVNTTYPTVNIPFQVAISSQNQNIAYTLKYGEQVGGEWLGNPTTLPINTPNFQQTYNVPYANNDSYGIRNMVFELTSSFGVIETREFNILVEDPSQVLSSVFYLEYELNSNGHFYTAEIIGGSVTPNLISGIKTLQTAQIRYNEVVITPVSVIVTAGNPIVSQGTSIKLRFNNQIFPHEDWENVEMRIRDVLGFWSNWANIENYAN